jgi:glycosyltransferase involved in cell wall biosynthesis
MDSVRLLATLVSRQKDYDLLHFHYMWPGVLLSPLLLHPLRKKAVFEVTLLGEDNPSAIADDRGPIASTLLRRFDGAVAVSPALADDCERNDIRNVLALPNFLAVPELEGGRSPELRMTVRTRHGIPPDDPVLLFVGSATYRKGLDVLVEAFVRVARDFPSAWLIVSGPSRASEGLQVDPSFVQEQRARVERARLTGRVVWTGTINDRCELAGYYSAADLFVLPTRREGLGNVLIEALAAGLPTVAANLPGITDSVVANGVTGFLVPRDDAGAAAEAVSRLLKDGALRARMASAGRTRSQLFSFEGYCLRLRDFYLSVMGSTS